MKPFLKWPGGKYKLLGHISPLLKGSRLIEPFVGAGSVFLNTDLPSIINDVNPDLINLYVCVRDQLDSILTAKDLFINDELAYYTFREYFNRSTHILSKSKVFLYLNKHGFNGLCRYNSKGKYNVPFGEYKNVTFPEKELLHAHHVLQKVQVYCEDFVTTMCRALPGDVIYCDPPYSGDTFTNYSGSSFNRHQELVDKAILLQKQGIRTIISDHYLPSTEKLYINASDIRIIDVQRSISAGTRDKVQEMLAIYA